jgi:NitT/TauT family transport system ATP-binding protein
LHDIVLEIKDLHHAFGPKRVLFGVNLQIVRGQIVSLVGPSGCGKSTLLRAILGTHPPNGGEVLMNGELVRGPSRARGIVYQHYSLFPFMTALENVAFGLMLDQTNLALRAFQPWKWLPLKRAHRQQAEAMLDKVGLSHALHQYPAEMSGGMCQRVAIAQALVMKPEILLLDEPFGALDEATREELQQMLRAFREENVLAKRNGEQPPYTILIVTHELNEAIYVADRVLGLSQYWDWKTDGHAECPGATIIYDRVASSFVPGQERNFDTFLHQRTELRSAVFDPDTSTPRRAYVSFWDEVAAGQGAGVMQP